MISRKDAEAGFVLSLLKYDDDHDDEIALARLYSSPWRPEPAEIENTRLRSLYILVLSQHQQGNVITIQLAAEYTTTDPVQLAERCAVIDRRSIDIYADILRQHIEQTELGKLAKEIHTISDMETLTVSERRDLISACVNRFKTSDDNKRARDIVAVDDEFYRMLIWRQSETSSGRPRVAFPFPVEQLNEAVPYLYPGEMILITSDTGVGKSSFASQFFDGNVRRKMKGMYFRFEDSDEKAGARRVLRMMYDMDVESVPAQRLSGPHILRQDEWDSIKMARGHIDEWGHRGIEVFCHGWSMDRAMNMLRREHDRASKTDEPLMFAVIDYLNKAELPTDRLRYYGLASARGQDAELLKTATEELGIVTVLVQQHNPITDMPFETTQSLQKSQVWLCLQRDIEPDTGEKLASGYIAVRKANMGKTRRYRAHFDEDHLVWKIGG